jgi:hypothetical protein
VKIVKPVVNIWPGDEVRLPSGAKGSVIRWFIQQNKLFGLPDERVAEVKLQTGGMAEFSERLMSRAVKVGA